MSKTSIFDLFGRLTLVFALAGATLALTSMTGCKAETNEEGAQVEVGDPDSRR